MIFSYWYSDESLGNRAFPSSSFASWKRTSLPFEVFTDQTVLEQLSQWGPRYSELFCDIRIPACRADISRLVILFHYGGLYVDAHCSIGNQETLSALLDSVPNFHMTLFDELFDDPEYSGTGLLNSILGAKRGSPYLENIINASFENLRVHREREAELGRVDYSIYCLTGPSVIWEHLFQRVGKAGQLRPELRDGVRLLNYDRDSASVPVLTYVHNEYRDKTNHWSIRQKTEPLFFSTIRS